MENPVQADLVVPDREPVGHLMLALVGVVVAVVLASVMKTGPYMVLLVFGGAALAAAGYDFVYDPRSDVWRRTVRTLALVELVWLVVVAMSF